MRRNAMQQLYDWKEKSTRKPLIIRGARQVGKTWLMKEFAATAYKQFAYINFEDNEVMKEVFQKDFDIERILMAIQLVTGKVVDTDTLILFDELQEAIQVYFFSRNKVWKEYERIQSDIFDHFFAMIPKFELKVYQYSE